MDLAGNKSTGGTWGGFFSPLGCSGLDLVGLLPDRDPPKDSPRPAFGRPPHQDWNGHPERCRHEDVNRGDGPQRRDASQDDSRPG